MQEYTQQLNRTAQYDRTGRAFDMLRELCGANPPFTQVGSLTILRVTIRS